MEPLRRKISASRRFAQRPYAQRWPREYRVEQPGDLVQVDTLDVRPLPGVILKPSILYVVNQYIPLT